MAKSALDAGWARLKTMWEYKSHQAGVLPGFFTTA